MKCIAIDDEPVALRILSEYCRRIGDLEIQTYTNPEKGMEQVRKIKPDLLFLDIEMGEMNGIDLARSLPDGVFLIFTTAYAQYAVEGFELNAVDYLQKPFTFSRFEKALQKVSQLKSLYELERSQTSRKDEIDLMVEYKHVTVNWNDILYLEAMDNYVRIYLYSAKPLLPQMSLKTILSLLPAGKFVRVHKSYVIPLSRIARYTRSQVWLKQVEQPIPIGRTYVDHFLQLHKNNTSVKIYRSIVTFNISIMSRKNKNQTNIWIAIEAIFLIILLIIWLTVADFTGDTDVAAFIAPAFSGLTFLKL